MLHAGLVSSWRNYSGRRFDFLNGDGVKTYRVRSVWCSCGPPWAGSSASDWTHPSRSMFWLLPGPGAERSGSECFLRLDVRELGAAGGSRDTTFRSGVIECTWKGLDVDKE